MRRGNQRADQLRVQRVARLIGDVAADNWRAGKRKIADRVQNFMAHEFIAMAQTFRVDHPAAIDHQRIF